MPTDSSLSTALAMAVPSYVAVPLPISIERERGRGKGETFYQDINSTKKGSVFAKCFPDSNSYPEK